jgi:hypothetical protein
MYTYLVAQANSLLKSWLFSSKIIPITERRKDDGKIRAAFLVRGGMINEESI